MNSLHKLKLPVAVKRWCWTPMEKELRSTHGAVEPSPALSKLRTVMYAYNLSTGEGRQQDPSVVCGHPQSGGKFDASLSYMILSLKKK